MLVSFDIKFIRRDQKSRRNGEACQASPTCFWSSLINSISKDIYVVFHLLCIINRYNDEKTVEQMKSRRILFERGSVANALLRKSVTTLN